MNAKVIVVADGYLIVSDNGMVSVLSNDGCWVKLNLSVYAAEQLAAAALEVMLQLSRDVDAARAKRAAAAIDALAEVVKE